MSDIDYIGDGGCDVGDRSSLAALMEERFGGCVARQYVSNSVAKFRCRTEVGRYVLNHLFQ